MILLKDNVELIGKFTLRTNIFTNQVYSSYRSCTLSYKTSLLSELRQMLPSNSFSDVPHLVFRQRWFLSTDKCNAVALSSSWVTEVTHPASRHWSFHYNSQQKAISTTIDWERGYALKDGRSNLGCKPSVFFSCFCSSPFPSWSEDSKPSRSPEPLRRDWPSIRETPAIPHGSPCTWQRLRAQLRLFGA